jgi:hypothetical protein
MTTNTKASSIEIHNTLDDLPHETFGAWESEIQDIASGMATAIHPRGLLSLVLTDPQWVSYPGNTVIVNGAPQTASRYQPLAHVDLVATMTSQEILVAKEINETRRSWTDLTTSLKRAITKS